MAQKYLTFKQVGPQNVVYYFVHIACNVVFAKKRDAAVVQAIPQSVDGC